MGKVIRVKKGNQEFDVEEGKLQLALNDGFTPVKEEKVLTVVKGDKEFQVKESNLSAAMADGFKKKDATTPSQNGGEETSVTASETPSIKYEYNPLSTDQFNQPVIQTENGTSLPVNPKSIPVTPAINQKQYLQEVQQRIKTGTKTPQDETFIDNVKKANNVFGIDENETLTSIANKYDPQGQQIANLKIPDVIANFIPSLKDKTFGEAFNTPDGKLAIVEQLKNKINDESYLRYQNKRHSEDATVLAEKDEESKNDLRKLDYLKNTLTTEKQKTDIAPIFMDIAVRRDQSGNILKKAINRVVASTPAGAAAGGAALSMETEDRMERQPVEFSIGLNGLKYREPAQYERVMKMLNDGAPLSESMIANIVAQGADDKEAILKDQLTNGDITPQQFADENKKIQQVRVDNIVKNKEVYTAFVANGIANLADDVEQEKDKNNNNISGKIWGNRWNYTDEEIQKYGAAYIKANGLDPDSADAKYVIKYLQDNEGALIMENSIAKAGYVRDLAKGLAQPIRGIAATVEDLGKSNADIYTESMSQGNVNVSEERVSRIKTNPIENAVSDVLEGTGQFLTQAGLAAATSGALGMAAESLAASGLGATTAGETIGTAANIGNRLLSSKDAIATVVTAYAQSYDSNLKQALSYTADDGKAKLTANVMSGLEGATELFLSPLEIAQGIGNKLFNKKKISKGVVDILSDAAIVDKNAAIKNFLKASAKGVLETGKVAAAEIGEEEVTQIADYVSNAMLNPDSKSFKNRDLANEMVNTAYQTGLSMALPALVSGVGAFNVNNFSKGSLLIAAQNRQHIIDDMNQRLHNGEMTQDQYNEKATIVNTAANANQLLPVKDNGKKLNTEEKANYVYSRVSEAVLNRQLQKLMEDKSRDVGKIGEGEYATKVEDPEITQLKKKIEKQIEYRAAILQSKGVYVVNGERVDKAQLNEIIKSGDLSKYDISISNDDKLQNKVDELRKPKEPAVKPEVVAEETKIEVPVEGLGEFQEETVVVPKEEPLKANLQAAREQAAALPLEQQQKPTAEVAPLQSNLEAARQQGVVEESSATLADERAKQLLGQNAPQTTVAPKEQNLEAVRNQQVQKDLEEQQLANVANERVAQMALDKIPMTDAASKALAKMDKVKGKKLGIYRQIAQQNPKGFLKEIAQQARGVLAGGTKDSKTAMKEAVKNYTQDVVNEALAMFPEENKVIQNEPAKEEVKSSTTVSSGVEGGGVDIDFSKRKKEMQSEHDKLIKRKRELANDRDDVVTSEGKYKNFGKKERDARLEEIRNEVNNIDSKQEALQKELKVIEAKEKGSVELFDNYASHGSTNTILYDIKRNKLYERENITKGKTKEISIEDAAKQKFEKTQRGRNQREINEAYTDKVKAKYEAEINDEINKYKSVEQSLPTQEIKSENKPIQNDPIKEALSTTVSSGVEGSVGVGGDENAWGSDKGLTENFYTTDVDGYAIKKPITNPSSVTIDGVDFHIAKVDGDWKVIEKKSGLEISTGKISNTKNAAIEDATIRLAQNGGAKNLPTLIDRAIQGFKDRNTKAVEQSLKETPKTETTKEDSVGVGDDVELTQEQKVNKTTKALDGIDKADLEFISRKENNRRKGSFYEKAKGILFKGFGGNASIISDKFGSKYKYFTDNPDYAKSFSLEKEYLTQKGKVEKYQTDYKREYNTNEKHYNEEVLNHSGKKSYIDLTSKDYDNFNDKLKDDGYDVVNIKRTEPLIPSESYRGHSADIRNVEVEEHLILNDKAIKKIADQPSLLENNAKSISEAYHKAKADGSNPELVKAVEQSLKETPKSENKPIQNEPIKEALSTTVSSGVKGGLNGVESFETSKGSKYVVGEDGKTSRFKTATNEQKQPQDLTVFAKFEGQKADDYLEALHGYNGQSVHVLGMIDGKVKPIETNEDAAKATHIKLTIVDKDGKITDKIEASTEPIKGYSVFDQRKVSENKYEKHIGNEISKINYKENKPIQNEPIKEGVESNQLPKIETTERDKRLFSDIASALSVVGQKNKEAAIESLYAGRKAKYSKEEVDAAIAINKDFEKIVAEMQKDELLTKECKT